ncbi:unnamed protein product [Acanthosepion pharaonis]|uniref:Uncharacterized protein n=1 Tax=Acanthosepion pharaonis TaxID=158019 RepID=A0A812CL56_ACAPH|nr:unnamed protein product [Sepia pharaonis]
METCITKLELGSFPETDLLETEAEWAPRLMEYHRELGDLDGSFSPSSCLDPVSQSEARLLLLHSPLARVLLKKTARRATVTSSFHVDSNILTSAGYSRSLPPSYWSLFSMEKKMVSVNCLLDTGSGRSYLSADVLRDLGSVETVGVSCRLRLFTLLGECDRNFTEVVLGVDLGSGEALASSVLVTDAMDLSVRLAHLETLLGAFRAADYNLAGQFEAGSDLVLIKGIIGLDLIHRLITLKLVPCLRGWAFSVPSGLVPFGTVDSFLSGDKIPCEVAHLSFNTVMGGYPEVNSSHLCFVLENQPTYLDPLAEFFLTPTRDWLFVVLKDYSFFCSVTRPSWSRSQEEDSFCNPYQAVAALFWVFPTLLCRKFFFFRHLLTTMNYVFL